MTTEEILNELKTDNAETAVFDRLSEELSVSDYMNLLLSERNAQISKLVFMLGYDRCYVYQFFNGKRAPTRTFLLRLAVLLSLSLEKTQRLLTLGGKSVLYPKIKRDAALIYVLEHGIGAGQVNEFLERIGVRTLF